MMDFLTRQLYLLVVSGSIATFSTGLLLDWPLEALVVGWSALALALGALLERHAPFNRHWRHSQGDIGVDATSAAVLIGLVDPLLKAGLPVLAVALLGSRESTSWPLTDWPFASQVALAVLWMEFAKYWSHRAHHELPALWRLHALHHSSERLYWLNNFRFHPVNYIVNMLPSLLPLLLLGVPDAVLLGAIAVTQPVLMLQHLNLDTRSGWVNWIFSTNELHRWHHSAKPIEANSNYGSALVIWDQVFGTYRPEAATQPPARLGLFSVDPRAPTRASYWTQLIDALIPQCCRAVQ